MNAVDWTYDARNTTMTAKVRRRDILGMASFKCAGQGMVIGKGEQWQWRVAVADFVGP